MYVPDNYDLWEAHDKEQERALEKLPVCGECGEPIQDDFAYKIDGEIICEDCLKAYYRVDIEELM